MRLASVVLLAAGLLSSACQEQPSCTGDLQPYKGKCLSSTAIEYVGCTEGRGISPTTKIGGGVAGTFKVVADASLELAYEKSEAENTPVALQIVRDCLAIAKETSNGGPEAAAAQDYEQRVTASLEEWQQQQVAETAEISLSVDQASIGDTVTVTGSNFWPNETVDIRVHATLVEQVRADDGGRILTEVVVPTGSPPPDFMTTISASGQSSSRSARAPFHT